MWHLEVVLNINIRENILYEYGYIHELDRQIKELHNRGMVLTAVIVLQWNYQQQDLILPGARSYGYNLYGWNTQEATGSSIWKQFALSWQIDMRHRIWAW